MRFLRLRLSPSSPSDAQVSFRKCSQQARHGQLRAKVQVLASVNGLGSDVEAMMAALGRVDSKCVSESVGKNG
jgi:hypothetical protein